MTDETDDVGVPPTFRDTLKEILAHAASQERTVIEFRTTETAAGNRHFSNAIDVTEHVSEMEDELETTPDQ